MLIVAAILFGVLSWFHSVIGEKYILGPTHRAGNLPKIWGSREATFRTIQATWHLVTVMWLGLAATLLILHFQPENLAKGFLLVFGTIFAALTIVPFVFSAGKHKSWIAFGIIAAMLLGKAFMI